MPYHLAVPSPRILFSTAAFFARPLAETFRLVADAGYEGVEVLVTSDPSSQDPRQMRDLADRHGLEIGALHAPCLLLTRRVWGTDPVGKIYRSIEVASDAGVPLVVVHPPFRWQLSYRRLLEEGLLGFSHGSGVEVAIENMFPLRVGSRGVRLHANADLDELDRFPNLVLDTSHAAVAGHDLRTVRERFGERLRHVHLSDNAGKGWDSHLPLGEGILPLDGFLEDLRAGGFAGTVSLEVDLRGHLGRPGELRAIMARDRERCEAALGYSLGRTG